MDMYVRNVFVMTISCCLNMQMQVSSYYWHLHMRCVRRNCFANSTKQGSKSKAHEPDTWYYGDHLTFTLVCFLFLVWGQQILNGSSRPANMQNKHHKCVARTSQERAQASFFHVGPSPSNQLLLSIETPKLALWQRLLSFKRYIGGYLHLRMWLRKRPCAFQKPFQTRANILALRFNCSLVFGDFLR